MSKSKKNGRLRSRSSNPVMLTADDVAQVHERLTFDFSLSPDPISPPGIRSVDLLESAVIDPATKYC
jgi:hypothetical protein